MPCWRPTTPSRNSPRWTAALIDRPFILLDLPSSGDYFMSIFAKAGLRPNIRTRSRSPDVIRSMVAAGRSYSIANVRPMNRFSLTGRELAYVRLEGEHPASTLRHRYTARPSRRG